MMKRLDIQIIDKGSTIRRATIRGDNWDALSAAYYAEKSRLAGSQWINIRNGQAIPPEERGRFS
jgi:hypothetical protein